MAATVVVWDKICNKNARVRINDVNIDGATSTFREKVSGTLQTPLNTIELIYAGQVLKDDKKLSSYGIKPGVTVFALRRHESEPAPTPAPVDRSAKLRIHGALQSALVNPAYRSLVERVLSDPQTLETMLANTPALENDPVAISILQDQELLAVLADPNLIDKVLEDHPALGHAALSLVDIINKEVSAGLAAGLTPTIPRASSRGSYSLDAMSDDEDEPGPVRAPAVNRPITSDQLTAALAAATGAGSAATQAANSSSSQPPSSGGGGGGGGGGITADALRLAMQEALGQPPPPPATGRNNHAQFNLRPPQQQQQQTPAAPSTAVTQEGLAALRDMGITDEEVARRALEASNGDIAAAVDIIFGNGI